jgi:small GTP-binding protein
MKKLVIGILAHVDAGKTTLAEGILYLTGSIRKLGRVDHKDAFLDTYEMERARGITIFSKQAVFSYQDLEATLLDTPGHVDFSSEMERTLQVLDYAILVISGSDGVQGHTLTLWRLLTRYRVPTFLFVNKMDLEGTDRKALLEELKRLLDDCCEDFGTDLSPGEFMENLAMCDEALLNQYTEKGQLSTDQISASIANRKIFPCYFGSALRLEGVEAFLQGLAMYTTRPQQKEEFGAKVFKIAREEQGNRLTYMKITGGRLKVKELLSNRGNQVLDTDEWEEKVDQIRIYSGTKYETVETAEQGCVCAVTGLSRTYPGEGLGTEAVSELPMLEPVLNYKLLLPPGLDAHTVLLKIRQLEEEDPLLHIVWSDQLKEIHVQLMGEVQVEVLKAQLLERFGFNVEFDQGNIVYKETIQEPVMGVGHFEPLRHYAEVHLLLTPGEPGSGLEFDSSCSEDGLDRNWQRLILTHLEEKEHIGVLTGSPITDLKVTLVNGRAHLKHTEGGDFRQATYRAVRQALKKSKSILLEPYYNYRLEIPAETVGRAMSDLQKMCGSFNPPEIEDETAVLTGSAPVATMQGYQTEVSAYTKGRGRLFCLLKGYEPCHNSDEVIERMGYDSERDLENPTGSVFCAHGAGFTVNWNSVEEYMHLEASPEYKDEGKNASITVEQHIETIEPLSKVKPGMSSRKNYEGSIKEEKELEEIFIRTFGPIKQKTNPTQGVLGYEKKASHPEGRPEPSAMQQPQRKMETIREYLLVDGYNIIFSWEELSELAKENMDAARNKLMDILSNYQGFKNCILILVFDAYKVKGGVGEVLDYHNIHVVYTKEAETADQYIEKVTHEIAKEHRVTVATSDALEQLIILGKGALRLSAGELKEEVSRINEQIRNDYLERLPRGKAYLGDRFDESVRELLDEQKE